MRSGINGWALSICIPFRTAFHSHKVTHIIHKNSFELSVSVLGRATDEIYNSWTVTNRGTQVPRNCRTSDTTANFSTVYVYSGQCLPWEGVWAIWICALCTVPRNWSSSIRDSSSSRAGTKHRADDVMDKAQSSANSVQLIYYVFKSRSSGLCRRVVLWLDTNVSKGYAASIFRRHNTEDLDLNVHCRENNKSHNLLNTLLTHQLNLLSY
jgi:hypothetical protein